MAYASNHPPSRLQQVWSHPSVQFWMRVLRLGLFQFGMGLSLAPITGTLNRVLIDELRIPALIVGFLIAIHYFVSPIRTVAGYYSDQKRASGKWRLPQVIFGSMLTFGGLATAPFSLILLGGNGTLPMPFWVSLLICVAIFLVYGIGVNIVETTYLAVVSDVTAPRDRGRVLATLWMMLVFGTIVGSISLGYLLQSYNHIILIQVMQSIAVIFVALTWVALWKQERLRPDGTVDSDLEMTPIRLPLGASLRLLFEQRALRNLFVVLFLATLAFSTHDVLLEPYGGQVLDMSISATTQLTALWGVAMVIAIVAAGLLLWKGSSAMLPIVLGSGLGVLGFLTISLSSHAALVDQFRLGVAAIGAGRGMFIVGSVALVMSLADRSHTGLFMGLWGMMQALAQGFGTIGGGLMRDVVFQRTGDVALGYTAVYGTSLVVLALVLVLLLVMRLRRQIGSGETRSPWSGLQDVPADQLIS